MESDTLIELFYKVSGSSLSLQVVREEVAQLTSESWSAESIFFGINYSGRYLKRELEQSLYKTLAEHKTKILMSYSLAVEKRNIEEYEGESKNYDPKNQPKGNNKPSWFRKSFNSDLFE